MAKLKKGDNIKISNIFTRYIVEIDKVTKTQAITKPYNDAGATHRFKIETADDGTCHIIPFIRRSTTEYKLIKTSSNDSN